MMRDTKSIFIKIEDHVEATYNIAEINWLGVVKFMKPVARLESYDLKRIANASAFQNATAFRIEEEEAIARGYKIND